MMANRIKIGPWEYVKKNMILCEEWKFGAIEKNVMSLFFVTNITVIKVKRNSKIIILKFILWFGVMAIKYENITNMPPM